MDAREVRRYYPLSVDDIRLVTLYIVDLLYTMDMFTFPVMDFECFQLDVTCIDDVRLVNRFKFIYAFLLRCKDIRFCRSYSDIQFIKESFENKLSIIKNYRINHLRCNNFIYTQRRLIRYLTTRSVKLRIFCMHYLRDQTHLDRCMILEEFLNFTLSVISHVEEWRRVTYSRREE